MNTAKENHSPTFVPCFSRLTDTLSTEATAMVPMIILIIQKKLETADAVYYLGMLQETPFIMYFLIITSDDEQRNSSSLNSMIEESCRGLATVTVFVHNAHNVESAVNKGNIFFNSILLHKKLLYLSGRKMLPQPQAINYLLFMQNAVKIWGVWYNTAIDFITGASFYMDRGNNRLALFSLHQATECILKAINRAIIGYKIDVHNLSRLLTISTLYTKNLIDVFPMEEEEGKLAFDLLKDAYTDSRYKDNYEPDANTVKELYGKVVRLQAEAERLYLAHISSVDNVV